MIYDSTCSRCKLAVLGAKTICMPGVGATKWRAMIVGEAPGSEEDERGLPFIGVSGQLLDRAIQEGGASRLQFFVTNAAKCRPPKNRNPEPDELTACFDYLYAEMEEIRPRAVLVLGNVPMKVCLGFDGGITKLHGKIFARKTDWGVTFFMPAFHPAYIKRNPHLEPELFADVREFIEVSGYAQSHTPSETWAYSTPLEVPEVLLGCESWDGQGLPSDGASRELAEKGLRP